MPPPVRLTPNTRNVLRDILQGRFQGQDHGSLGGLIRAVRGSTVYPQTGAGPALTLSDVRQEISIVGAGEESAAPLRSDLLSAFDTYVGVTDLEAKILSLEDQIAELQAKITRTTNRGLLIALEAQLEALSTELAQIQSRLAIRTRVGERATTDLTSRLDALADDQAPPPTRPVARRGLPRPPPQPVPVVPAVAVVPTTKRVTQAVDLRQLETMAPRPAMTDTEARAIPPLRALMQGYFDACSLRGFFVLPDDVDRQGLQDLMGNLLNLVRFGSAQLPLTRLSDIHRLSEHVTVLDAAFSVVERAVTTVPSLGHLLRDLDRLRNTPLGFVPVDDQGNEFQIFVSDLFPDQRDPNSLFENSSFWRYYQRAIRGMTEEAVAYRDGPLSDPSDPSSPRIAEFGHRFNLYSIAMGIWAVVRQLVELMQRVDEALQIAPAAQPTRRSPSPDDDAGAGAAASVALTDSDSEDEPIRGAFVRQRTVRRPSVKRPAAPVFLPQVDSDEEAPIVPPRGDSRPASPTGSASSKGSRKSLLSGFRGLFRRTRSMPDLRQDDTSETGSIGGVRSASSMTDLRNIEPRPRPKGGFRGFFSRYKKAKDKPEPMTTGSVPEEQGSGARRPMARRGFWRRKPKQEQAPPPPPFDGPPVPPRAPRKPLIPQSGVMVRPRVAAGGAGDPDDPRGPGRPRGRRGPIQPDDQGAAGGIGGAAGGAGAPGGAGAAAGGAGAPDGNPGPRKNIFDAAAANRQRHNVPYRNYDGPAPISTLSEFDLGLLSIYETRLADPHLSPRDYDLLKDEYAEALIKQIEQHKFKNTGELNSEDIFGVDASLTTSQKTSTSRPLGERSKRKTAGEIYNNYRFFDIRANKNTVLVKDPSLLSSVDLNSTASRNALENDPYFQSRMNNIVVAGKQVGIALSSPKVDQLPEFYRYLFESRTPCIHVLLQEADYMGDPTKANDMPRYFIPENEHDRRKEQRGKIRVAETNDVQGELKNTVYIPRGGIQTGIGMMEVSHRKGRVYNDDQVDIEAFDASGRRITIKGNRGSRTQEYLLDLTVNGVTHSVKVLQSGEWKDMHGTPPQVIDELLAIRQDAFQGMQLSDGIVHCRAGVGRTGTLMVAEAMQNTDVSMLQAIDSVRASRNRVMVQKAVQGHSLFDWAMMHDHRILHDYQ